MSVTSSSSPRRLPRRCSCPLASGSKRLAASRVAAGPWLAAVSLASFRRLRARRARDSAAIAVRAEREFVFQIRFGLDLPLRCRPEIEAWMTFGGVPFDVEYEDFRSSTERVR